MSLEPKYIFFQDPSILQLRSIPFLPDHVVHHPNILLQPTSKLTGVPLLCWLSGLSHPCLCPSSVSSPVPPGGSMCRFLTTESYLKSKNANVHTS